MKHDPSSPVPPPAYRHQAANLASTGWICQGSAVSRKLRRKVAGVWCEKGPYYYWTCKVDGKTVCRALSQEQYVQIKAAIEANRQLMSAIAKMQSETLDTILAKVPGVSKRK